MATFVQNFACVEQRSNLAIGTTASAAAQFTYANVPLSSVNCNVSTNGTDCMVINTGAVGAQLAFGGSTVVAVNTAAAGGTKQYFIPAGAVMIVSKGANLWWSAITDTGTTGLILHAGQGD